MDTDRAFRREKLVERLREIRELEYSSQELDRIDGVIALLEYIDDAEVTALFQSIMKRYA